MMFYVAFLVISILNHCLFRCEAIAVNSRHSQFGALKVPKEFFSKDSKIEKYSKPFSLFKVCCSRSTI